MTRREREDLRRAVRHFYADGCEWENGMRIVLRLAGMSSPALDLQIEKGDLVSLDQIPRGEFRVNVK